jgi:hypothetical protein
MRVLRASTNYYKVEGRLNLAKLSREMDTVPNLELLKKETAFERLKAFADLEAHLENHAAEAAGTSEVHLRSKG